MYFCNSGYLFYNYIHSIHLFYNYIATCTSVQLIIDSDVHILHHSISIGNLTSKPSSWRSHSFPSIEADPLLPPVTIKPLILSPDWNLLAIGVEEFAKAIWNSAAVRSVCLAQKGSLTLSDVIQVYCAVVGEYLAIQFKVDICVTNIEANA